MLASEYVTLLLLLFSESVKSSIATTESLKYTLSVPVYVSFSVKLIFLSPILISAA
jgi:hypothetical protein